ncbi:MAG: NAD-dependent epimerase/dehydratase family protein [Acidobacteriota bacterium]|nr:NAD-dependent epimerase/dehydratase family protein [Acidobacteriota bacterium]
MAEQKKTICVTGGAGFIGSHLVDAFLRRGHRVLVIDDLSTGREGNLASAAEFHPLDVVSPEAAKVVEDSGADLLVHQAAQMNVRRSVTDVLHDGRTNVLGGLNMFEAARRGGVPQILFASTGGAIYGDQEVFPAPEEHPLRPLSPYGVSKLASESYLYYYHQTYGMDVTCLRYANVYGPRQNPHGEAGVIAIFLQLLLAGQIPTIYGDGLQTRDYVHIDDVVAANLAAANLGLTKLELNSEPGYRIYNVGTGVETSVVDLYRLIAESLGSSVEPRHGAAKAGEQLRSSVDPRRALRELDLPEPRSLASGLPETVQWFAGQAADVPAT